MLPLSLYRLWRRLARPGAGASQGGPEDLLVSRERYVPDLQPDVPYGAMHVERYRFAAGLLLAEDTVLDMACGAGYGTHLLARSCCEAVGVDCSPAAVEYARGRYAQRFLVGDFFEFEGEADVVVSFETAEHIRAPLPFVLSSLAERSRRLLIGSIPYLEAPGNPFHFHFGLSERNLDCLKRYGALEVHYQDREPGFEIRREKIAVPQNLVFAVRRRARPGSR